jgi:hypothetical protein
MEKKEIMKERIGLDDTFQSALIKLAEGNPGALTALLKLATDVPKIDPDSFLGNLTPLLDMDSLGIYGSNIWILYKDVCGADSVNFATLTRAWQLGYVPEAQIVKASIDGRHSFDFVALLAKVRARLPRFAKIENRNAQEAAAAV